MSEDATITPAPQPTSEENRHASWLELFFDLVAVAGVAQIAHLLHGVPDMSDLGLYALLFLAFWTAWIVFTLCANVAYENTHVGTVPAAVFGMAGHGRGGSGSARRGRPARAHATSSSSRRPGNATRWLLGSSLAGYFLLSGLVWLGKAGREQR